MVWAQAPTLVSYKVDGSKEVKSMPWLFAVAVFIIVSPGCAFFQCPVLRLLRSLTVAGIATWKRTHHARPSSACRQKAQEVQPLVASFNIGCETWPKLDAIHQGQSGSAAARSSA